MEKIDNIRHLYKQINKKTKFIILLADDLNLSAQYVRICYFSSFWAIPKYKQDRVIEVLKNVITHQEESVKVDYNRSWKYQE